jgi:hypothetical protein
MVDFTNIRDETKIREALKGLKRQGRMQAVEFAPIEIDTFMLKIKALDNPNKWNDFPWTPAELAKLTKMTELKTVSVQIYMKRTGTELYDRVSPSKHKDFTKQVWAQAFDHNYGKISTDTLVEVIRYIQVLSSLVAFI